jgi:hypothetical protein
MRGELRTQSGVHSARSHRDESIGPSMPGKRNREFWNDSKIKRIVSGQFVPIAAARSRTAQAINRDVVRATTRLLHRSFAEGCLAAEGTCVDVPF